MTQESGGRGTVVKKKVWNRRELVRTGAIATCGAALTSALDGRTALGQLPKPQPLHESGITFVTTTESQPWKESPVFYPTFSWTMLNLNIGDAQPQGPPMDGFGACFNELGWVSLQALNDADRTAVMRELFDPSAGARFTYCRMPIGANDFATEAYSYDETDGDFDLKNFNIDHDRKTLVPFIQSALKHQPDLKLWASPWTPPSWMKRNHFYAEAKGFPQMGMKDNGIRPDQIGHEGQDMFIQEPRYFEAYARYFGKFIEAYKSEGIKVGVVMPQNEFNSAQNFPSCTWTAEGLTRFLHYLVPEMEKRGVEVYFGTLERGNPKLLETVMADKEAARYVKGLGVQWAGKNALPALHQEFPNLTVFQSEQECGDGKNAWSYAGYCWRLMKHYLRSGASGYMYWNISLASDPHSAWGWAQNSLVTVDTANKTYRFNHDYYVLKHVSHSVDIGAKRLESTGTCDEALAFRNPDGKLVAILRNESEVPQLVQVQVPGRALVVEMPPDSLGTLSIGAK
jgi:glucosylceramidase